MIEQILEERGNRYGEFAEHARLTQEIKDTLRSGSNWYKCTDSQMEALEMIAHKMARIVNGDPTYIESWRDIGGYNQLVIDELMDTEGATDGRVVLMHVEDGRLIDDDDLFEDNDPIEDDIDWQSLTEYTQDGLEEVLTGSEKFANDIVNLVTKVTGKMEVTEPEDTNKPDDISEIEINGIKVFITDSELAKLETLEEAKLNTDSEGQTYMKLEDSLNNAEITYDEYDKAVKRLKDQGVLS